MVKAYTNIEQSRKLAEILSADSADMCLTFVDNTWNPVWGKADDIYQFQKDCYEPDYTKDDYIDIDEFEPKVAPCWSLAALLGIIRKRIGYTIYGVCDVYISRELGDFKKIETKIYDNEVDACVEMILKLQHELNLF